MTQTIGQRLKAEREAQRLTLEKVFQATRIRIQYLQALETDDLSVMPSPVQARGYLRNYAEFLGFDVGEMLHELRTISTLTPSGPVVGPADEPALLSLPLKTVDAGEASPPEDLAGRVEDLSAAAEETVEAPHSESEGAAIPVHQKPIDQSQPRPARRKKSEVAAAAEPASRRRGRKKIAPETVDVLSAEPDPVEEPVAATESMPEPDVAEPVAFPPESSQPVDVSDTLWQTWLSRLGPVLSGRMRRRALIPRETKALENEVLSDLPEPTIPAVAALPDRPLESWNAIFKEIGRELRSRRELLSLHFDEVERNTHVKAHYLDALERGSLDELPSTVQTRGMLSNYATFLDLDVDALLLRYADALQARHRERNPQKPPRKPGQPIIANMPPMRSFIAGDMIFGVGMAVLLVGFAIWGVSRVMTIQGQQEVQSTAPSISDVLLASPDPSLFTPTPTFLPVEAFPGEATVTVEIPTQNVNADVQLNLVAVERTYMRVIVDGEVAFDGRVVPGNAYPFEAEQQIEVLVGSGAAIRTVYNGRDLGLMGAFGQVVNNIYAGAQIITPTALPLPSPTITLTPTPTESATPTAPSTSTSVPSSTAVP